MTVKGDFKLCRNKSHRRYEYFFIKKIKHAPLADLSSVKNMGMMLYLIFITS